MGIQRSSEPEAQVDRRPRRHRVRALAALSLLVPGLAVSLGASPAAATEPGMPGTPQPSTLLFEEDFENLGPGVTSVMLDDYTGASGTTYTAHANWVDADLCNGFLLTGTSPDHPGACSTGNQGQLRTLATNLGTLNGTDPADTNVAVSAYTAGDPGAGNIQLATEAPIALPVENRFLSFSVNVAAVNCQASAPLLRFFLVDDGVEVPATTGAINPCTGGTGTYATDGSILFTGDDLGIVMRNDQGSGTGNDFAFDDIRLLDTTPQLDKAFEPAEVFYGGATTLELTVTNTDELAEKDGWSLVDALPPGLTVADPPNASTDCTDGAVTGDAGATAVSVSGDLDAGQASCTASIDVVAAVPGSYTNCAENMTELVGLNPPGCATATFTVQPTFDCPPDGLLFQFPSTLYAVDMVSGEFDDIATDYYSHDINAVGYNVLDDYVYGVAVATEGQTPQHLVRVGGNGSVTPLPFPAEVPVANYHVGDVDENGHLWISNAADWYQINVAPDTPDYLQMVDSGTVTGDGITGFADWSYVPDGQDSLYTVAAIGGGHWLFAFDRGTGTFDNLGALGTLGDGGGFGATYADPDGFLYASQNSTGSIFRIDIGAVTATPFAPGPISGGNDGARCFAAEVLADLGDAPDSYGTTLAADGARHGLRDYDADTGTTSLMLGDAVDPEDDGVPGPDADGDDLAGADDEEGVVGNPIAFAPGEPTLVDVVVTNGTGEVATLAVWLDSDRSGAFDPGELVGAVPIPADAARETYSLTFDPLDGADPTYARFRLFPGDVAEPSPTGPASAGEVEDAAVIPADAELTIEKTGDLDDTNGNGAADVGEVITYAFLVTNTGNVALTGVTVEDPLPGLSPVECPGDALVEGAAMTCTATYTVTQADVDAGEVVNAATASGVDPWDQPVESEPGESTVATVAAQPGLDLTKDADLDDANGNGVADAGEVVRYSFLVTNTGNVTMSDIAVDDPMPGLSPVTCPTDVLAPGEDMTCTATYQVQAGDLDGGELVNTATVSGLAPGGGARVSSSASTATVALAAGAGALPRTGTDVGDLLALALLLLLLGAALVGATPAGVRRSPTALTSGGGHGGPSRRPRRRTTPSWWRSRVDGGWAFSRPARLGHGPP